MEDIKNIIARFDPISLAEMDGVKLQDRVDTKYVLGSHQLPDVLKYMKEHYKVLQVSDVRGTDYRTLYFDTEDLRNYLDHHNKRTFRNKVRIREYLGSGLTFLEVKKKTGRGRTDKKRLQVPRIEERLSPDQIGFVAKHRRATEPMVPTLWNHFTRYTFVNKNSPERLTLDLDLRFTDRNEEKHLGNIVVAELKQERADRGSAFVKLMRSMNERPCSLSKYCIGMLLVGCPVKHNSFKPVLLKLDDIRRSAA